MGIRQFDIDVLTDILKTQGKSYKGLKLLQLGDQVQRERKVSGKKYFESLGAEVISIDINGLNESLPLDLSKPIDKPEYREYFDVITNYGTSEHVSNHKFCFKNMYDFCTIGGVMLSLVPREGCWNNGSHRNVHKYNTDFFTQLASEYNCEILINRVVKRQERFCDDMIMAALRKRGNNE